MIASLCHRRALAALASFVVAASLPGLARGDDARPAAPAPEPDAPQETVDLDEIVVRVAPPAPAAAAPGSAVTVVEAEQYAGEAKSVGEMLATAPGVAVRDYGGLGQLATVSIRGSSADGVTVLLDGLPLNTAFGGGVNLSSIPRQWISALEVVRGAEGARFGAGALGGAVNIVTRPASAGTWNGQLLSGSYGTWSAGADAAFGGPRWGTLVALGWDQSRGRFPYEYDPLPAISGNAVDRRWRENNAAWSGGVLAKAFALATGGRWDALAQLSGGEHELPGSPAALTLRDRQEDRRAIARVRHARTLAPWLRLTTGLSGRYDTLDTRIAAAGGDADQRDAAGAADVGLGVTAGRHVLDVGARGGLERLQADGIGADRDRAELAVHAADELALFTERVRVGPAVRWERVGAFDGWSAKLGVAWRAAPAVTLRASGGRTFRAPSFAELYLEQAVLAPNPLLRPETAWTGDGGLELRGGAGLVAIGGFAALYDDLIVYQPATFERFKPFNAARSRITGLEAEVATRPWGPASIALSAAYTWTRSTALRGEPDVLHKEVPHRPEHRLTTRIAGERRRVSAHVESQWIGAQWLDTRNLREIPSALTFGAGASVRMLRHPSVHLQVELRNLLDRRDLQDGFGNPLPARMILAGLRAGSGPGEGAAP